MQAEINLVHPVRLLVVGRSGAGKTTTVVDLVNRVLRPQVDRVVVCCPTWNNQTAFACIRDLTKGQRDILDTNGDRDPFYAFFRSLKKQKEMTEKNGTEMIKTLLFVDDMAADKNQHDRFSFFGKIALQSRHFNLSIINIVQQPKLTSPDFRQNIDAAICFPPSSTNGCVWLHEELNLNLIPKKEFEEMIYKAWKGNRNDIKELGSHFLFVLIIKRKPARYFIDFKTEFKFDHQEDD